MNEIITIDGGVATGTTTLAKNLAKALNLPRIDSGSLYRAITFQVIKEGIDPNDESACTQLAKNIKISMPEGEAISVNDTSVKDQLHNEAIDKVVPIVAGHTGVREVARVLQHSFAQNRGAVVDGRDIGTIVFPQATLKLFLTCSDEEAARRRGDADGRKVTAEEVNARNVADRNHKVGALAKAEEAVEIDTTKINAERLVNISLELLKLPPQDRPTKISN